MNHYIRPNFHFTYNGKRLCLNDISDWAFFANKLFDGAYDDTLINIHGMDDWEDSVFPWEREEEKRNHLSRKGRNRKARQSGKRNADKAKRLHKADRYHGKHVEPYLYKEYGVIKESIEDVWKRCRYPVSDKVHYHSALKADAREQDFFLNPSVSEMEIEQEEKRMSEEEERILDNHYMVEAALTNFLKEGKYISLLSYWNGEYWEDSDTEINQFCGIKTAEEVKDAILAEQAKHLDLSEVGMDTVHGMDGVSFKWNGFYRNRMDDEECGYRKLTFLPLN